MSNFTFPRWPTQVSFIAAVALHLAVFIAFASVFVLLLSVANLLPFWVCLMVSRSQGLRLPAFLGSAAALGLDAFMNYELLVATNARTSPIPLIFGPGVNFMFGVVPGLVVGGVVAFLWPRIGKRREGASRGAK